MATVFLARDVKHGRPVALKLLSPDIGQEIGTERFEREIRLAARLQHPHICSVYDSGSVDGQLWFTMPFVEGESLDTRLEREGTLPVEEAIRIAREAALALAFAHERGVVHRDIKPANILLASDGTALVADFGIARAVGSARTDSEPTLTAAGFAPGTPAYMSPEQSAGVSDLDGRTDVYSLGVVLYEMLSGERPFGGGALAAFAQFLTDPIPRVRARRPEVPAGVDAALQRALAPDPERRYPTMSAFGAELEALWRGQPTMTAAPRAFGRLVRWIRQSLAPAPVPPPAAPTEEQPLTSVAVLPFRDLSPAQDQAYFSEGLAEELTTALARVPGLRVTARSGAFQFRGADVDPRAAGRKLGVGAVVSGSVRKSGDRLRVNAQVVGVGDGFERWSETYDRGLADIFQVQDEIARAITAALRVTLLGASGATLAPRGTSDLEAYDLYLQGRFAWHQRTGPTLSEAARRFEAAAARDPSFARAWAGLADACTLLPIYSGAPPTEVWPRAKSAALRAIALDDRLAEAHASLAYGTMMFEWDWGQAEAGFRRAIAADPQYPIAHHWYADFLAGRNRLVESLAEMSRALELDPLSRISRVELAWIYYLLRKQGEADLTLDQVLRLDPTYSHAHFVLGLLRHAQGRHAEASQALRHSMSLGGFHGHMSAALVATLAAAGDVAEAHAELDRLTARATREYVPPFSFVVAFAGLGDLDAAYQWLRRGVEERDVLLPENFFDPLLDPIRGDPRYAEVERRLRE